MRTLPPCKSSGTDCPERRIGCRADCQRWQEWVAVHEREMTARREEYVRDRDVDTFLVDGSKRYRRRAK